MGQKKATDEGLSRREGRVYQQVAWVSKQALLAIGQKHVEALQEGERLMLHNVLLDVLRKRGELSGKEIVLIRFHDAVDAESVSDAALFKRVAEIITIAQEEWAKLSRHTIWRRAE